MHCVQTTVWKCREKSVYGHAQVPLHLREDFSGTSLISAAWCKSDVRRTALGVDIDREALQWGWTHNAEAMLSSAGDQLCLIEANVSLLHLRMRHI